MKQTILIFLFGLCLPLSLLGQKIKTCPLDTRPFAERLADFTKIRKYKSGFSETNPRSLADRLEYGGGWIILINYSPLSDFIGISEALVQSNAPFAKEMRSENPHYKFSDSITFLHPNFDTHVDFLCQRDFIATWEIRDNKLYLKDIMLYTPDMHFDHFRREWKEPYAYPDAINPSRKKIIKRLEKATGRNYSPKKGIFADWFNGDLIGQASITPTETSISALRDAFSIRIRNGIVENIRSKKIFFMPTNSYYGILFFDEAEKTLKE